MMRNYTFPDAVIIFNKFWWSEELTILKQDAVETDRAWKAARRPRFGPIFDKRQRSRLKYWKCIRECQNRSTLVYTNDLHDALLYVKMELSLEMLACKFSVSE